MTTYTATRISRRLYEYVTFDDEGNALPSENVEDFNDQPHYHQTTVEDYVFDSVNELVAVVCRDFVRFDATGYSTWASDPDGSTIIDYRTAEREEVSWHFDAVPDAILNRVIIPAVDRRPKLGQR